VHVVVTPCRDEVSLVRNLVKTMSKQTVRPDSWVIVLHNYPDSSIRELEEETLGSDWISLHRVDDNSTRRRGAQIARIVNFGISHFPQDWDFLSKIDSDVELPVDYFESILSEFSDSQDLGIASGSCYVLEGGRKIVEKVSDDHTRGALKTYRRQCFEDIGGIAEVNGWDGIDNIKAQMKGWTTKNFPQIQVKHSRRTGAYSGLLRGCFEAGQFSFSMRYYPPYIFARSMHRMISKPIIIGGVSMLAGYFHAYFSGHPSSCDKESIEYLRRKQKNRISFWNRESH